MNRIRITVPLDTAELAALVQLSHDEKRHPRDQAAVLIRRELERAGLLPADMPTARPQLQEASDVAAA